MSAATATIAPPVAPPRAWFADPKLGKVTPLTVTADGRVFGHLASFRSCHLESAGLGSSCITAPKSQTGYARFHVGYVTTAEGDDVPTGPLIAGTPHAEVEWAANVAMHHYSNTGHAVADVHVGEDRNGIWVAGAVRPGTTAEQIRVLKASPLSGDWRTDPNTHGLELVACLAVNSPGFAIPRPTALVASTGAVGAMFAIGTVARDLAAVRNRAVAAKLAVIGMRVDAVRRGSGVPAPRTKPRPAPRRNLAELAAIVAGIREGALIASMGAPAASVQPWQGVIGAEGQLTGDNRLIAADALEWAPFPLPLRWAESDIGGHDGAVVVGRIDGISRGQDGEINARGLIDLGSPAGQEIARQIAAGFAGGISMDLDSVDATEAPVTTGGEAGPTTQPALVTKLGRVRGATLVQIPAFQQAKISLTGEPTNAPPAMPADGGAPANSGADSGAEDSGSFALDCGCESVGAAVSAPLSYVLTSANSQHN